MENEQRPQIAMALKEAFDKRPLCDIWRRQNLDQRKYTWYRNNSSSQYGVSKAKLDRFYIHSALLSSVSLCNIVPYSLSDHSAVTITIKLPSYEHKGSAYWHFNNSLLEDQTYKKIIPDFWID